MTNTKCSYGTSMSIFCIYNLKNHTFNEREREREIERERSIGKCQSAGQGKDSGFCDEWQQYT